MPIVRKINRAARDYPEHGIRKGQPYWWWRHARGADGAPAPKHYSATEPTAAEVARTKVAS